MERERLKNAEEERSLKGHQAMIHLPKSLPLPGPVSLPRMTIFPWQGNRNEEFGGVRTSRPVPM